MGSISYGLGEHFLRLRGVFLTAGISSSNVFHKIVTGRPKAFQIKDRGKRQSVDFRVYKKSK